MTLNSLEFSVFQMLNVQARLTAARLALLGFSGPVPGELVKSNINRNKLGCCYRVCRK